MTAAQEEFNNDGKGDLKVPGFGLPLDYWPTDANEKDEFAPRPYHQDGLSSSKPPRMTLRELSMLRFMNAVTEKHEWSRKNHDEHIVAEWRTESIVDPLMSDLAFDWCMKELKEKSIFYDTNQYIRVLDNHTVCVKSDVLVTADVKQKLIDATQPLLNLKRPDWQPNTHEKNSLDFMGVGEVVPAQNIRKLHRDERQADGQQSPKMHAVWSVRFQWLPCEVKFKGQDTEVEIASYINNLHPIKQRPMYAIIGQIITKCIKPWNDVLMRGSLGRHAPRIHTSFAETEDEDLPEWSFGMINGQDQEVADYVERVQAYLNRQNNPELSTSDGDIRDMWSEFRTATATDTLFYCMEVKQQMLNKVIHPKPDETYSYEKWRSDQNPRVQDERYGFPEPEIFASHTTRLEEEFQDHGLQAIVKLSSIELTPDKPEFSGESRHFDGMRNEHIVAAAIYYYDVENIITPKIQFRQKAHIDNLDLDYEYEHMAPLCAVFGTRSMYDEPAIQVVDSISAPESRLVVYSNISQHRMEPFKLQDTTKSGHCRFLVLYLVDPLFRIMSTANVPPQQHDWWAESTREAGGNRLPPEVMQMVLDNNSDWPMTLDAATGYKHDITDEHAKAAAEVERSLERYYL